MNKQLLADLMKKLGSIAATALMAAFLAMLQAYLSTKGVQCSTEASPAIAGVFGITLKSLHVAAKHTGLV